MSDWLPIETAPKDGTAVLLWLPDGFWLNDENVVTGFWSEDDWYFSDTDSHPIGAFGKAVTHWMPLPEPPQ
jgi:hypothetical protein